MIPFTQIIVPCWIRQWLPMLLVMLAVPASHSQSSSSSSSSYLLSKTILDYTTMVQELAELAALPELPQRIQQATTDLQFNRLSYYWEIPFQASTDQFSQVVLGRQDNTCYSVFHGLPLAGNDRFVSNPVPIPNIETGTLQRENCISNNDDDDGCVCRAQWMWVDINFPEYWLELQSELVTCMNDCAKTYGGLDQCNLVMGGHGQGGMVAQLISYRLATLNLDPYVITMGASNVLYDDYCEGLNADRYFRFVNTAATPDSGNYGLCFDDVAFLGSNVGLKDFGHTIALGPSLGNGQMLSLAGSAQIALMEPDARRPATCRDAHDFGAYQTKTDRVMQYHPEGVTPSGFADNQYCQVNRDCRSESNCLAPASGGLPVCSVRSSPAPTLAPITTRPTPIPTAKPTTKPTPNPTPNPTLRPTPSPTPGPTNAPTSTAPTESPSTMSPTEPEETIAPTEVASEPPTDTPTSIPTSLPTSVPTNMPTEREETNMPTVNPTERKDTTAEPTTSDSENSPTTTTPVPTTGDNEITPAPTIQSTPEASVAEELPLRNGFYRVTLVLQNISSKLGGFSVFLWEDETSEHIQEWIQMYGDSLTENDEESFFQELRVQANIVTQLLLYTTQSRAATAQANSPIENNKNSRHHRRRRIQSTITSATALEIVFEIAVSYRSPVDSSNTIDEEQDIELLSVIESAFQSSDGRKQYSKRLRDSNDPTFAELSDFALQVQNNPNSVASAEGNSDDGREVVVWALVGAAAVAVAVSITLFIMYLRRDTGNRKLDNSTFSNPNVALEDAIFAPASTADVSNPVSRLSQEIFVDQNMDDGISTLGDEAMMFGGMHMMEQSDNDDPTAPVNYAKKNYLETNTDERGNVRHFVNGRMLDSSAYHTTGSSGMTLSKAASGLSVVMPEVSAVFSENASFEEQFAGQDACFEVSLPAGKLGIIIDISPDSGEPIVRAMRPDSVLAGQVKVGDRLLEVDGQVCADMSAEQVSKLIAINSNAPTRKIMFVRKQSDSL